MAHQNTRVGFPVPAWLGGRNYFRNLFAAIRTLPDKPITPVMLAEDTTTLRPSEFGGAELVTSRLFVPKTPRWMLRRAIARTTGQDALLRRLLRREDIDVLSHLASFPGKTSARAIGWIPDFQHVHLPEFFTPADCRARDKMFRHLCRHCETILVSSETARADLEAFAPQYAGKARVLRFVASPAPLGQAAEIADLKRLYGFDGPYFILPNQFWAHKNHKIVLDALKLLKDRGREVLVLATGSTEDYRNPGFFPSLVKHATELDVLDRFRVLGPIPHDHLIALMTHSVAFLNPSRFAGWSTSVEEAKSMGKRVLLSDIAVHREQAPENGLYFPADEPEALAEALTVALAEFEPTADAARQKAARKEFPARLLKFGEAYRRIALP